MQKTNRSQSSIDFRWLLSLAVPLCILVLWQILAPHVPNYILPAPSEILTTFIANIEILFRHSASTILAAFSGLIIATLLAIIAVILMDTMPLLYRMFYPLVVLSQTIPLISVAPLFILWFGFGALPKIMVVILVCFFPLVINLLRSFRSLGGEFNDLMRSMSASPWQIICHLKFPGSVSAFFSGLRIAATYAIMGAVIGEWLGGTEGLGVYLIRSQRSFSSSQLFAAIFMVMLLSIGFFICVQLIEYIILRKRQYFMEDL